MASDSPLGRIDKKYSDAKSDLAHLQKIIPEIQDLEMNKDFIELAKTKELEMKELLKKRKEWDPRPR